MTDFDGDEWVLATTSRKLDPVLWALRHPRKLISTHVQESPSGLFEIHRAQREEMVKTLGIGVARDLSFEMFELRVASSNARLVRALRKKNPFLFLYEWRMVGPNRHEWWGDYPKARLRQK